MNSAETFVDIFKGARHTEDESKERIMTWLSESGKMEFFLFSSTHN
jgi:hypothetical protein